MTTTPDVPVKFDVGLNGRGYMIDTQYLEAYRSQTLDPIRQQADSSSSVGEASLNPEGYWRRSPESWHKGAGQSRYDASDSDPDRFHKSSGVDVWTEGQLSMLPDVEDQSIAPTLTGSSISRAIEAGGRLLAIENSTSPDLHFYEGVGSGSPTVQSLAAPNGDITDLCPHPAESDKFFFVDDGQLYLDSVLDVDTGPFGSAVEWIGDSPTNIVNVCSAGGRLFCSDTSGNLYDISATGLGTLPTALMGIGNAGIFVATYANGYTYFTSTDIGAPIYKTTVKADGSGLEIPTVAATLPAGEAAYILYGYLGFVLIQTSDGLSGLRLGLVGSDGTLTLGEQFLTGQITQGVFGARDYRARGQFIWVHGYVNDINSAYEGLVRLDLSVINDALVPAYAADLECSGRVVFAFGPNLPIYMLTFDGELWYESADFVEFGEIHMGEVSFGTREPKLFLAPVDTPNGGIVSHRFTLPDGSFVSNDTAGPEPAVEWRIALTPSVTDADMTVKYPILRALPVPAYIEIETVPILLHDRIVDRHGRDVTVDTDGQLDYLRSLRDGGTLIDYQDGARTRSAQVIGVDRVASQRDAVGAQWQGTAIVRMKVLQ